jgi:uncharacterized protein DUF6281
VKRESADLIELEVLRSREGPARPAPARPLRRASLRIVFVALAAAAATGIVLGILSRGGDETSSSPSSGHQQPRSSTGGSAAASCVAAVEWDGTMYVGTGVLRSRAKLGDSLGDGTVPPCDDMGGSDETGSRSVALSAFDGVPPDQALAESGHPSTVYVAPGWLSQIRHTPLHDLLYGADADIPYERTECQPGHTTTADVRARVRGGGGGGIRVTVLEPTTLPRENWIFPDARTAVTGGGATPRVDPGDVIQAKVLVCRHAGDPHFLKLVATELSLP